MAPPLSKEHLEVLNTEFYENKNLFGRDKLYALLTDKYDDHPSRRQIADWLAVQEINQGHDIQTILDNYNIYTKSS